MTLWKLETFGNKSGTGLTFSLVASATMNNVVEVHAVMMAFAVQSRLVALRSTELSMDWVDRWVGSIVANVLKI